MFPKTLIVGEFELDVPSGQIVGRGISTRIDPKTVDVLIYLAKHKRELVTRDQLMNSVWKGRYVTETQISKRIAEIRHALDDSEIPRRHIETLPKRGYRLICDATIIYENQQHATGSVPTLLENLAGRFREWRALGTLTLIVLISAWLVILYLNTQDNEEGSPDLVAAVSSARTARPSIAVLPFIDISAEQNQEYLADGMSDELLHLLAQNPDLRVVSRTSSFFFKNNAMEVPEIARRLNVDYILEGSISHYEDSIHVTAQLIDANHDAHLWSQSFDSEFENIFDIQNEIAIEVIERFELSLSDNFQSIRTPNSEAYNLFLQARFLHRQLTNESLANAVDHYLQVLDVDSNYVQALAFLGLAYLDQVMISDLPPLLGQQMSMDALNRALAIDPGYAHIHIGLAYQVLFNNDLESGAEHFARALELAPMDDEVMFESAVALFTNYDFERALQILQYLEARDPINPTIYTTISRINARMGQWELAADNARIALRLSPDHFDAPYYLGLALLHMNQPGAALEVFMEDQGADQEVGIILAHHRIGNLSEFDSLLETLKEKWGQDSPSDVAKVYAFIGEIDEAFNWLNKSLEYDLKRLFIHTSPLLLNLHADPRWEELLQEIGTTESQLLPLSEIFLLPNMITSLESPID